MAALPALGGIEELLSHGRGLAYGWRVDNGQMLVDRQVRSLLVGGVQGSGKTSFVALLVAQLVRMNARVILGDPDALNEQGLAARLAGIGIQPEATAHEPAAVLRLVLDAQHELMTRKGQGSHADRRPYIVAIDELPECLRVLNGHDSGLLRDALELIGGFSGRKHSMAVIMLGQSWSKSVVGSTAIRNLITSSAVFRMRSDEAFYMTNLKAHYWRAAGPDPLDLEPGQFYAVGIDSGAVRVRVPEVPSHSPTRARVREALRRNEVEGEVNRSDPLRLGPPRSVPEVPDFGSNGPKPKSPEVVPEVTTSVQPLPDELPEGRVVDLLSRGYPLGRVVRELTGLSGGDRY
jgi:hypothetical protein